MKNHSKSPDIELPSKYEEAELDISEFPYFFHNFTSYLSYFLVAGDELGDDETNDSEADPVAPLIEPDRISEQVIEQVLATLPSNDSAGYTKTLKKIKWDEIKIDGRKPKEIETIFYHAIKDVNKVRTLTEILNEAKQRMGKFHQHPDHPKRPKTLFAMFVQERFKKIKEENPEIENVSGFLILYVFLRVFNFFFLRMTS